MENLVSPHWQAVLRITEYYRMVSDIDALVLESTPLADLLFLKIVNVKEITLLETSTLGSRVIKKETRCNIIR